MEFASTFENDTENLCVATNVDFSLLASGSDEGISVWDVASRAQSSKIQLSSTEAAEEGDSINCVHFSPKACPLLWACSANNIHLFDLRDTSKHQVVFSANSDEVNQICIHKDDTFLASADDKGEIRVFDLRTRKLFKTLRKQHENICSTVQFSPLKPSELFSGGLDNSIVRWNFMTAKSIQRVDAAIQDGSNKGVNPPMVHSLAFSSDNVVAAGLGDCSVMILREKENGRLSSFRISDAHSYSVSQVLFPVFDPLSTLISGGNDKRICVYRRAKDEFSLSHTHAHGQKINWLASLRDGFLAVADCSNSIHLLKLV
jgi:WD40 repeat protein